MNELVVKAENVNGVLVTTSNRVAEELGVRHKDLLEKIDNYLKKFQLAELSAQFYIPSNYKSLNGRTVRNYLITKKGMEMIVQHSSFTRAEQSEKAKLIYKELGGKDIETISASTRFEMYFIHMLEKALNELGVVGRKQYDVGGYRIDFYIPKFNIAVEYDEHQHFTETNQNKDTERQKYIESKLGCKFIRCDYRDEDIVNVMKVVKEVM